MPDFNITDLPKSEVKIEFTITPDEAKPYLDEAVKELSTAKPIPGFRPGKATYEDAKRAYGEMKIWETALERIVRSFYVRTVLGEQIDTIGSPSVNVDQLVPGQDIKFTTISPIEPKVLEFPDLAACKVTRHVKPVGDERVEEVVLEMRKMRRSEALADRPATMEDLVVIDLEMKKDRVVLEGGSARDYRVYLGETHYIPGFAKQLEGIKAGEERSFTLEFPKEHFQKHLAGQPVDFTAKAKGVYELKLPAADDAFAKGVGIETMDALRAKLRENLDLESKQRAEEAAEIELLDKLVDAAKFSELPDLVVNEEVRRMIHELEHGVEEQGMQWQDYLSSIKKTADELKLEFAPQAVRRIKTAVLVKQMAKREKITVSEDELNQEVDRILATLKPGDAEARGRVSSPDYREYIATQMRNRKVVEWLKKECIRTMGA